jgi:hypothetical protein
MKFQHRLLTAAAVTAAAICAQRARALVSLEDGRDHIFVDATVEMGYDSNVFANSQSGGSTVTQGTLAADFVRRAGWIGVNVTAALNFARYSTLRNQDYVDPKVTAELTKQSGRTTGSLTLSVQKQNRTDVDVNTRDVSWNYDAGLNFQYPVIQRYSISGSLGYDRTNYEDHLLFTDLTTYTGSLYLYYILNEQRDLFISYRYRLSDLSDGERDTDNALSGGVSGKVIGPFNGSLGVGYETRSTDNVPGTGNFGSVYVNGTLTWNINRRMNLTSELSRDFSTTANAISIETTSVDLTFQDSFTAKSSATLDGSVGENRFLGAEGMTAPNGAARVDQFASLSAAYFYTLNQHLKISLSYTYYRNWSTVAFAEFPRSQVNLTLASHW